MRLPEPRCFNRQCRHFIGWPEGGDDDKVGGTLEPNTDARMGCRAFPGGIPDSIGYGDDPHTSPHPGDNGIQYERGDTDANGIPFPPAD